MKYTSIDQVVEDMSQAFQRLGPSDEVQQVLRNIGDLNFQIYVTDLKAWMTQVIAGGEVRMCKGQVGEAPVKEHIDSDSFEKIMSGAVEPPELAMAGKINFEGDFSKVFMLQPLLGYTIKAFQQMRRERPA